MFYYLYQKYIIFLGFCRWDKRFLGWNSFEDGSISPSKSKLLENVVGEKDTWSYIFIWYFNSVNITCHIHRTFGDNLVRVRTRLGHRGEAAASFWQGIFKVT